MEQALVELDAYLEQKKSLEETIGKSDAASLSTDITVVSTPLLDQAPERRMTKLVSEKVTYEH